MVPEIVASLIKFNVLFVAPPAIVNPVLAAASVTPLITLFVSDSVPAIVAIVPDVGKVILVIPVLVSVVLKLPTVAKSAAVKIFPPSVMVLFPLFTPVPP